MQSVSTEVKNTAKLQARGRLQSFQGMSFVHYLRSYFDWEMQNNNKNDDRLL